MKQFLNVIKEEAEESRQCMAAMYAVADLFSDYFRMIESPDLHEVISVVPKAYNMSWSESRVRSYLKEKLPLFVDERHYLECMSFWKQYCVTVGTPSDARVYFRLRYSLVLNNITCHLNIDTMDGTKTYRTHFEKTILISHEKLQERLKSGS